MLMYLSDAVLTERAASGTPFVLYVNNYFSLPRAIAEFRNRKIAVAGTARSKRGWPPSSFKVPENIEFNDFFWVIDEYNTLVARGRQQ